MTLDSSRSDRIEALKKAFTDRILVLDSATGTYIQDLNLTAEDFGGEAFEGCNEVLNLMQPDKVRTMHREYLEAQADIIETNTFGGTPLVLAEFSLEAQTYEINRVGAELARGEADAFAAPERPRWVAGSIGPTTKAISVTGGITFEGLEENFHDQAAGLVDGGVDYLLIETSQDTRNVKAALLGCERVFTERGYRIPVAVSGTIEPMGTMLAGQSVEAFYTSIAHAELLYVGLNCATGPAFMTDHLRTLAALAAVPVGVVPNAGLPDSDGNYLETPEIMNAVMTRFLDNGWVNLIGGCCGTTVDHVRAFAAMASGRPPRTFQYTPRTLVSGIDFLEVEDGNRPVLVGERTNAVGSRLFKRLIAEEKFEESSEIARRQVRGGAQIIDINLANPDRDEHADMRAFLEQVINKVKAPLMIDSTDASVIEIALPYCQGKSIINSINLEDGEQRFEQVVPMGLRFGAAFVVGTIDEDPEQGMGITRQRKLDIALRSHTLLTEKYGVPPEDLIFDPLVFPCATGDEQYVGSAVETIEGVRLIKQALPLCKTVLGISNVSFGLPAAGREVLNAVFLYHCVQAGLDMAIVNTEKLERYATIPEEERKLADDLLFNRGDDPIAAFANFYRDRVPTEMAAPMESLSLDERLAQYIIIGSKDGLVKDLEEKRKNTPPLEIVNGPLMSGMGEVGRLFNDNQLIVAEVLQSAEAMKAAVSHLEQFMDKADAINLGTMVLATVKGDVHDIGKNLVDIIFSNNGYNVINLGIKILPQQLIQACIEHKPDMIGLSGLLVKSAQQMVATAEDLQQAGIGVPLLVGGAALSKKFTRTRIGPAYENLVVYAKDAMSGLSLANRIMDPEAREQLVAEQLAAAEEAGGQDTARPEPSPVSVERSAQVRVDLPIPNVPDHQPHRNEELPLDEIWDYLNLQMLYGKHMGFRANVRKSLEQGESKTLELQELFERLKTECRNGWMTARVQWQFFQASSDGNHMTLTHGANGTAREVFEFPRQRRKDGLCLADFVLPADGERKDTVCLFVTTAGEGIRERAQILKDKGEYLMSHGLQALALETAEASAEWLHTQIRTLWGIPDPTDITMTQRFQAKYRGKRYSFGYPACPNLEDQAKLWNLLSPARIGVELTDGFMMEPEASVSAIAFHHPDAVYFSVGKEE